MKIIIKSQKSSPYAKEEFKEIATEALPNQLKKAKGTIIISWVPSMYGAATTWRSKPNTWHVALQKGDELLFLSEEPLFLEHNLEGIKEFGYAPYLEHESGRDYLGGILAHEFSHIKQGMAILNEKDPKHDYYQRNLKYFPELQKFIKSPKEKPNKEFALLEREAEKESKDIIKNVFWNRKRLKA